LILENNCLKNATNTNKEQGEHQRSQKQNKQHDQNLKRKHKKTDKKQGEYEHKNLINNRKGVTFNHSQTHKLQKRQNRRR